MKQGSSFNVLTKRLWFDLRAHLAQHPSIFLPFVRLKRKRRHDIDWLTPNPIGKMTEIVIEGFPRSANTFATVAFQTAQTREVNVAHHIHAPSQIIEAVHNNIPAIALIREPADSALSLVIRLPHLTLKQALKAYLFFYKPLLPFKGKFVVAPFEKVTHHFDQIIQDVNTLYGKSFALFEPSEESIKKCFSLIEERNRRKLGKGKVIVETFVARPSSERYEIKQKMQQSLNDPHLKALVDEGLRIYQNLIS